MALLKGESKEWASVRAKGKRHGIAVKRVGPANVVFGGGANKVYAQLGTGRATQIMDARIKVNRKRGKKVY